MHNQSIDNIEKKLKTNINSGLTNNEVQARLSLNGYNKIESVKSKNFLIKLDNNIFRIIKFCNNFIYF